MWFILLAEQLIVIKNTVFFSHNKHVNKKSNRNNTNIVPGMFHLVGYGIHNCGNDSEKSAVSVNATRLYDVTSLSHIHCQENFVSQQDCSETRMPTRMKMNSLLI